jgi:RNA polymerase sigma factor (sigma-70 family)
MVDDERALVTEILAGNMNAYQVLIKKYERLVGHMVAKLIDNREELEEVCQDVFLKVYNKLAEFNFQSKLSTWIATIAYRHAINATRKNRHLFRELPADNEGDAIALADDRLTSFEETDIHNYVLKLVDKLPPQYKVVLTLYHVEEMSYEEIGAITGMPEGTVKNYLFRARTMLKEKVKRIMVREPGL